MLVLDANIIIEIERSNKDILKALEKLRNEHPENIATTSAVYAEVYFGLLSLIDSKAVKGFKDLENYGILNFDKASAKIFSTLKYHMAKKGKPIPVFDLLTAAIAIRNGATLVSKDKHFEGVPNLKLIRLI